MAPLLSRALRHSHRTGHPNVVCLKNVYEDKSNVCLVMELCTGVCVCVGGCARGRALGREGRAGGGRGNACLVMTLYG